MGSMAMTRWVVWQGRGRWHGRDGMGSMATMTGWVVWQGLQWTKGAAFVEADVAMVAPFPLAAGIASRKVLEDGMG